MTQESWVSGQVGAGAPALGGVLGGGQGVHGTGEP